jgi:metal-responsive CopG/Arc/MetJ family transcriptional regulator
MEETMEAFTLSKELLEIVSDLAKKKGISREEVIRQALTMYAFFQTEVANSPKQKLSITSTDTDAVISDIELP